MASRIGILAAAFLSYAILPLLPSASFPDSPGLLIPGQDFINPPTNQQIIPEPENPKFEPVPESEPVEGPVDGAPPSEPEPAQQGLREGFYEQSCPQAEKIVNETIRKHFLKDPTLAPALVRLFFHDCFVTVRSSHYLKLHFLVIVLNMTNT